jgi:hypothetical protein
MLNLLNTVNNLTGDDSDVLVKCSECEETISGHFYMVINQDTDETSVVCKDDYSVRSEDWRHDNHIVLECSVNRIVTTSCPSKTCTTNKTEVVKCSECEETISGHFYMVINQDTDETSVVCKDDYSVRSEDWRHDNHIVLECSVNRIVTTSCIN